MPQRYTWLSDVTITFREIVAVSTIEIGLIALILYGAVSRNMRKHRWGANAITWFQITTIGAAAILGIPGVWISDAVFRSLEFRLSYEGDAAMGQIFFKFLASIFCGITAAHFGTKRLTQIIDKRSNSLNK